MGRYFAWLMILVFEIHRIIAINPLPQDFIDEFLEGTTEPPHDAVTGNYDITVVKPGYDGPKGDNMTCSDIRKLSAATHPDINLNCPQIIEKNGYNLETHKVTTEDGYILTIYRIKGGPKSPPRSGKTVAFLQHGLLANCMTWLFLPGNKTLAFKLADAGYDVYLGNARGTSYSQKHKTLDVKSDQYWDFSFEEIGYFDIPAVIDYVLNITAQKDLYYIAHSLGTSHYMVSMSLRPEYALKIRVGFLLAPAGAISDMTNPQVVPLLKLGTTKLSTWKDNFGNFVDAQKLNGAYKNFLRFCPRLLVKCNLCSNPVFYAYGYNPKQTDGSIAYFYSKNSVDATSTKLLCHVAQVFETGVMSRFDFEDKEMNIKKYNQINPPSYPLNKIAVPTVAFFSINDNLTPPNGTKYTFAQFTPGILVENNRVQDEEFNHVDFILAKDVNYLVYDRLQYIMDKGMYLKKSKNSTKPSTTSV